MPRAIKHAESRHRVKQQLPFGFSFNFLLDILASPARLAIVIRVNGLGVVPRKGRLVVLAILLIIVIILLISVIVKGNRILLGTELFKTLRDILLALQENLNECRGYFLVPIVVEGSCDSFIADASGTAYTAGSQRAILTKGSKLRHTYAMDVFGDTTMVSLG